MTELARAREAEPSWHGYDPTAPDADRYDDPFPHLARMRRDWPVNETPAGLWRFFRYADCVRVLRELPCGVRRADGSATGMAMGGAGSSGGQFMLQQDPPNHTRLRKLVSKAFTPRAVERWRPRVREIVAELLAPALDAGRFDLVAGLAHPLPSQLICEMLGVPSADRARFTEWTAVSTHLLRGVFLQGAERVRAEAAASELAAYFHGPDRRAPRPARRRSLVRPDPRRGGGRPPHARGAPDPVDRAPRGRLRDHGGPDRARREEPDRPSAGARQAAGRARSSRPARSKSACASRAPSA